MPRRGGTAFLNSDQEGSKPNASTQQSDKDDSFTLDGVFDRQQESGDVGTPVRRDSSVPSAHGVRPRFLVIGLAVVLVVITGGLVLRLQSVDQASVSAPFNGGPQEAARHPAGLPGTGSLVESRLRGTEQLEVRQWIRSLAGVSSIVVKTPTRAIGSRPARVEDIAVVADGIKAPGVRDDVTSSIHFLFGVPAKMIALQYTLKGAVEASPSAPGRALVRSSFLRVDYSPRVGPTVVRMKAPEVLSLSCSGGHELLTTPRPCGTPIPGGWEVTLRGADRQDRVMAQVDLAD